MTVWLITWLAPAVAAAVAGLFEGAPVDGVERGVVVDASLQAVAAGDGGRSAGCQASPSRISILGGFPKSVPYLLRYSAILSSTAFATIMRSLIVRDGLSLR
jgi:hypothetical protein